ncbi:MAG: hypothetical protein IPM38_13785 [Ignavibacteria bacterium]|nr:hypothetical protein [Ignavibacteria bacterium]
MTSKLIQIENASAILSKVLKSKSSNKYKLLQILNFYTLTRDYQYTDSSYSFYIQFIDDFTALIQKDIIACLKPEEIESLLEFIAFLKTQTNSYKEALQKSEDKLNEERKRVIAILSGSSANLSSAFSNKINIALIEQNANSEHLKFGTIGKLRIDEAIVSDEIKVKFTNQTNSGSELLKQLNQSVNVAQKDSKRKKKYKLLFEFEESDSEYDGSSLGCAAACLAFNSMFRSELHNFYYRFKDDAVITGAVDNLGILIPLSEESLKIKLETVFYSEYNTFVIPRDNFNFCYDLLEILEKEYPERKLLLVPVSNYKEVLENTNVSVRYYLRAGERINSYYKKYQQAINVAAMVVIITGLAYAALGIIIPELDKNPVNVEYTDNKYILKNKYGKPVWESKKIGKGRDRYAKINTVEFNNSLFLDFDGNDEKEFIYVKSVENKPEYERTIFITSGDSEKIFYSLPVKSFFTKRGDTLLSPMYIFNLNVLDSNRFGYGKIFFEAQTRFFPCVIGVLDSCGNLLSEFWNYGHLSLYYKNDFDKDGHIEYYFGGSNNKDNCAFFTVFDTEFIDGASPEHDITGNNKPGTEKYYINIPGSKLLEKSDNMRNHAFEIIRSSDTSIFVSTKEMVYRDSTGTQVQPYLMYYFDRDMNCVGVVGDDYFTKIYNIMQKENPELEPLNEYYKTLRNQVMWWDGEKYVNERAINKEYLKRVSKTQ